jgi:hypothetical protein
VREEFKSSQGEMRFIVSAWIADINDCQKEMKADREATEANPADMMSVAVHEEFCMEDAAVKSLLTMKKQHRGQHLATERCEKLKELTRGDCGSWRKFAAAYKKMSHCAAVAWHKGNILRKIRNQGNCELQKKLAITHIDNPPRKSGMAQGTRLQGI